MHLEYVGLVADSDGELALVCVVRVQRYVLCAPQIDTGQQLFTLAILKPNPHIRTHRHPRPVS